MFDFVAETLSMEDITRPAAEMLGLRCGLRFDFVAEIPNIDDITRYAAELLGRRREPRFESPTEDIDLFISTSKRYQANDQAHRLLGWRAKRAYDLFRALRAWRAHSDDLWKEELERYKSKRR